jgi:hypothetical protein
MTLSTKPYQNSKLLIGDDGIRVYIRDPIDHSRVLRNDTRTMLFNWCNDNCKGKYWVGMGFGMFELENDATLFKLRWS